MIDFDWVELVLDQRIYLRDSKVNRSMMRRTEMNDVLEFPRDVKVVLVVVVVVVVVVAVELVEQPFVVELHNNLKNKLMKRSSRNDKKQPCSS